MSEEPTPEINTTVDLQIPIVSLDMDDTTVSWDFDRDDGHPAALFNGALEFIKEQIAMRRACIVATAASKPTALSVLKRLGVTDKLSGGEGDIFAFNKVGTKFRSDYGYTQYDIEPECGFPVDSNVWPPDIIASSPFISRVPSGAWKDFGLLRRHLAGHGGDRLRLVHISDSLDLYNVPSDPETVMICVDDNGQWLGTLRVRSVLDHLFADSKSLPAGVFDTVFEGGSPRGAISVQSQHVRKRLSYARVAACSLGERKFTLARGEAGERVIFEI